MIPLAMWYKKHGCVSAWDLSTLQPISPRSSCKGQVTPMHTCPQPASSHRWAQRAPGSKLKPNGRTGLQIRWSSRAQHSVSERAGHPRGRATSGQNQSVPGTLPGTGRPTEGQRATKNTDLSSQFLKCHWVAWSSALAGSHGVKLGDTRPWTN